MAGGQYGAPPQPGAAMYGPGPAPPQTYVVQGGFDAGARFDGISQPSIPVSRTLMLMMMMIAIVMRLSRVRCVLFL